MIAIFKYQNNLDGTYLTAAIDPQADLLIHELLQLWRVSLGHDGCFLVNLKSKHD